MTEGIVYVLTNPAMPRLVKIGITNRENIDDRIKELYNTSVPVPFECEYACRVKDCDKVENALRVAFKKQRINPQREFFDIEPDQAIAILSLLSIENITTGVKKEVESGMKPEDIAAGDKLKKSRRPPLNFTEMGIPLGSKLLFNEDGKTIEVEVVAPKKVKYNGEVVSLTRATREILESEYDIQPTPYWKYKEKSLDEIYEETYKIE